MMALRYDQNPQFRTPRGPAGQLLLIREKIATLREVPSEGPIMRPEGPGIAP